MGLTVARPHTVIPLFITIKLNSEVSRIVA